MTSNYKELGECIELIIDHRGKTPKKMGGDWVSEGVKTISAKNVHGGKLDNVDSIRCVSQEVYKKWMKEDIKRGDCLLASEGATLGENLYWNSDDKVVIGQRLYCIRTDNSILDSKYFSAYMNTHEYQKEIEGRATGTSVLGIKQTDLLKTMVLIKDIEEQRFIGNLYFEINDKIETNNRINKKLEEMAQAIFKQWFVDFEFPNEDGEPYKSGGGEMVESELGMIPSGWSIKRLLEFGDVITGKTPSTKVLDNFGDVYNFITPKDIDRSIYILKSERLLSEVGAEKLKRIKVSKNSIGVSCIGSNLGEVYINAEEGFTNQQINTIELYKKELYPYFFIILKNMKEDFLNLAGGSAVPIINKTTFSAIKILIPEEKILYKFIDSVTNLFDIIQINYRENNYLTELRDSLLPKLMSGEIRVPLNN